jgi:hypothetical protein
MILARITTIEQITACNKKMNKMNGTETTTLRFTLMLGIGAELKMSFVAISMRASDATRKKCDFNELTIY